MRTYVLVLFLLCCCSTAIADNLYIFTAEWCGPCHSLKNFIKSDTDVQKLFSISMIDIDEFPDIAKEYNIHTVPTSILIQDNLEYARIIGYSGLYKKKLMYRFNSKN